MSVTSEVRVLLNNKKSYLYQQKQLAAQRGDFEYLTVIENMLEEIERILNHLEDFE